MELSGLRSIYVWAGHPEVQRLSVNLTRNAHVAEVNPHELKSPWGKRGVISPNAV
jgi:hypothetical protein